MARGLSKARLAHVSSRPVLWDLLVRSSRTVWHTEVGVVVEGVVESREETQVVRVQPARVGHLVRVRARVRVGVGVRARVGVGVRVRVRGRAKGLSHHLREVRGRRGGHGG